MRLSTFSALVGTMQSSPYVRNMNAYASAFSENDPLAGVIPLWDQKTLGSS